MAHPADNTGGRQSAPRQSIGLRNRGSEVRILLGALFSRIFKHFRATLARLRAAFRPAAHERRTSLIYVAVRRRPSGTVTAQWWVLGSDGRRCTGEVKASSPAAARLFAEVKAEGVATRLGYALPSRVLYGVPTEVGHG